MRTEIAWSPGLCNMVYEANRERSPLQVPSCERSGGGGGQDDTGGGTRKDVIAPQPGELISETNDNSVAILLSYGTARVLLAGDAETREEYLAVPLPSVHTRRSRVARHMIAGDIPVYWKPPI